MKFKELMDCYYISEYDNNQNVYNQLVEQFRKQNITPVIGAGLSSWAYPLWGQMLSEQGAFYGIKAEIDALLENNKYEEAASLLEKQTTSNGLSDILKNIFDTAQLRKKAGSCPAYLRNIPRLFHGPIVTTNFDRAIEYLFDIEGKACPDYVTPQDVFQQNKIVQALQLNKSILVKMHGDIEDVTHLILTKKSYDDNYGDDFEQPNFELPMPDFLQKILTRNPLLFMGCSLGADRTCTVIKSCAPNNIQFAFLELPGETVNNMNSLQPILRGADGKFIKEFQNRRNEIMDSLNIRPIWYPYGMHKEALQAFFSKLCEDLEIASHHRPAMNTRYALFHPLLGRDCQVNNIVKEFTDKKTSCVWVVGPAGIGKTETCKAVYAALKETEPCLNMPYIDITGVVSLPAFFDTFADETKISIPSDIEIKDIGSYLIERLEERYPLLNTNKISRILYFDNWEDIWYGLDKQEEKDFLINWIRELLSSGFKLLFSSRELPPSALNSSIFQIESLDNGKLHSTPLTMDELDSVALFRSIMRRDITENELDAFSSLICQLEGHPLSIVLAATQARREISLNSMLNKWYKATQDTAGMHDKFFNLEVALKVSWNAISVNPEAVIQWGLHYYSLKPISWNVLMQLRENASEEAWDAALHMLIGANLTYTIPDSESVAMLLPLKKQFSHLIASDRSTQEACLIRWAKYIENLLEQANQLSENRLEAHYSVIESIPQIFYIMEQLMEWGTVSAKEYLDLIVQKVGRYYQFNVQSVNLLKRLKDYYKNDDSPNLLAIIYKDYGDILKRFSNTDDAQKAYDSAEPLFDQAGDRHGKAKLLKSRGDLLKSLGYIGDAIKAYNCAELLLRDVDDNLGLANLLKSRGDLSMRIGNIDDARRFYDSAEPLYCKVTDNLGLANLRKSRGDLLKETGDLEGAKAAYDSVEALYHKEHNDFGLANLLKSRGDLLQQSGDMDGAKKAYDSGECLYRKINDMHGLANLLKSRGDLLKNNNDVDGAKEHYDVVEPIYRHTYDNCGLANLYKSRGDLEYQRNNLKDSWEAYEIAESYYHQAYDKLGLANLYKSQGDMAMFCELPDKAYTFYKRAEELYEKLRKSSQRVYTLTELCKCCRQLGKISEAEEIEKQLAKSDKSHC